MTTTQQVDAAPIYRSTADGLNDALRDFLARQPFATLATHNADGTIHLVPTWYLYEDGRLYIATWSGSRKARNAVTPRIWKAWDYQSTLMAALEGAGLTPTDNWYRS